MTTQALGFGLPFQPGCGGLVGRYGRGVDRLLGAEIVPGKAFGAE